MPQIKPKAYPVAIGEKLPNGAVLVAMRPSRADPGSWVVLARREAVTLDQWVTWRSSMRGSQLATYWGRYRNHQDDAERGFQDRA